MEPTDQLWFDEEDELDINARDRQEISNRMLVLIALCNRAAIDAADSQDEPLEDRFDLIAWLEMEGVNKELTGSERAMLDPVTALDPLSVESIYWNAESLGAIASVVGVGPAIPEPPGLVDIDRLLKSLPQPGDTLAELGRSIAVPPDEPLAAIRERWELWHWRATVEQSRRQTSKLDERQPLENLIIETARDSLQAGFIDRLVEDDFPLDSRAFSTIDEESLELFVGATEHRLRALNWICGFGADWNDVPIEL
jgi:hypothetical protein